MARSRVIWHLPDGVAVALSSMVWFSTSLVVGWWAARWSVERVSASGPITRLRPWEAGGRAWQHLTRVQAWKDRLPEAGGAFGGRSKRSIPSRRTEDLQRFRAETIRAERVHWLVMATSPIYVLWCRPTVALGMVAFGIGFNAPFIVVQRYNRGRLEALLDARRRRTRT